MPIKRQYGGFGVSGKSFKVNNILTAGSSRAEDVLIRSDSFNHIAALRRRRNAPRPVSAPDNSTVGMSPFGPILEFSER